MLNRARLRAYLERAELDAIVLALPVSVAYATGHETSFETSFRAYMFSPEGGPGRFFRSFAVIAADGRRALVSHAAIAATSHAIWDEELIVYGGAGSAGADAEDARSDMRLLAGSLAEPTADRQPMDAVALAVAAVAPDARRVGVECAGLEGDDLTRLGASLPRGVQTPDASVLIRLVRMVKTADQIERLTRAATAAEDGLTAAIEATAPGAGWRDLVDVFRQTVAPHGADVDHVALGPRGLGVGLGDYVFRADDVTMLDVGCRFRSCISDTGVTVALSHPDERCKDEYEILLASIEAGAGRLRPGECVLDVYAAMRAVVDGTAVTTSQPQGHGLGQEPKEAPFIAAVSGRFKDDCVSEDANLVLEGDMVVNLEIPYDVPGSRSFQIEQTFLVTESGGRQLTSQPRSRIVTAGSTRR